MKIEFFGLPGVGKTHFLNLLLDKYPEIRRYCIKYQMASWSEALYDIAFFLNHPILIYSCNFEKRRDALLLRFKRIARRKKYIVRHDSCILNDSGTIQPLIEAYILSENLHLKIDWVELFNELIMDHCYFFINDSIDKIVHRELNRSSRIFDLNKDELEIKYPRTQSLIDIIKKKMFLYEFSMADYNHNDLLIDDLHKKIVGVLSRV